MKNLLALAAICFSMAGCAGIQQATDAAKNPEELLSSYGSVTIGIAFLLIFLTNQGTWRSILNAVRVTAALCVTTGPILWVVYGDVRIAAAVILSGILGLAVITVAFRKDLHGVG